MCMTGSKFYLTGAGAGWPEPVSYPVQECLLCILNEEWHHRLYAERDLDSLEPRPQRAKEISPVR